MTHFVQGGDEPVLIGPGGRTLDCACGQTLIRGFDPLRFLAIDIQCARCGLVSTTAGLPEGDVPPRVSVIAAPSSVPRTEPMRVPPDASVVGQAEAARLQTLFQPAAPDGIYQVSSGLLDEVDAALEGSRDHRLGRAVATLRERIASGDWACMEDSPTANAVTHVCGFVHFVRTWGRHPFFPAMMATVGELEFSLHGLAPFAAAHCLTMMGNRVRFAQPSGYPGRIDGFSLVAEPDPVEVHVRVFDRFEYPSGRAWDHGALRAAVSEAVAGVQGRINARRPGVLVLSPGAALGGFDEALIEAVKVGVQAEGRKNRGLMAVAPVVLRLQGLAGEPQAVRFGYGFFPILNRHYRGESLVGSV